MKYAFIEDHRDHWPIRLQCRVLEVSPSGYYAWRDRDDTSSPRAQRRAALSERVQEIHQASRGNYGSPRVHRALKEEGQAVAPKTVAAIMQEQNLRGKASKPRKPRTTDSKHHQPIAQNLIERDFTATGPDQKWLADITYLDTDEGWLYLAVILDAFSRRVIGWALADHLRTDLVDEALLMALDHREPLLNSGLIHHSDRGVQYASHAFQQRLAAHGIRCSMSRKGDCYDNAMMESFFGTLKTEMDEPLSDQRHARATVFDYIEVFYNRQRMHSSLDYKSPAAYEQKHQAA